MRIYIETSVISAYEFGDEVLKRVTRKFFNSVTKRSHELFTSDVTLAEAEKGSRVIQRKMVRVIKLYNLRTLHLNEDALILAEHYIKQGVIPAKVAPDAQHIAVASISGMEVLVSWNLKHIVNLHTKLKVKEINSQLGYVVPDIVRPDEMMIE